MNEFFNVGYVDVKGDLHETFKRTRHLLIGIENYRKSNGNWRKLRPTTVNNLYKLNKYITHEERFF